MIFQSILFIGYRKYKTLFLLLLLVLLVRHILLQFSNLYIGYLLNIVKLCCITHRALSLVEPHYLNSLLLHRLNSNSLRSSFFKPLTGPICYRFSTKYQMVFGFLLMLHHCFGINDLILLILYLRTYLLEKPSQHIFLIKHFPHILSSLY